MYKFSIYVVAKICSVAALQSYLQTLKVQFILLLVPSMCDACGCVGERNCKNVKCCDIPLVVLIYVAVQ